MLKNLQNSSKKRAQKRAHFLANWQVSHYLFMASTRFYLDTRRTKPGAAGMLKLVINHKTQAEEHPGVDYTKQGYLLFPYLYHRVIESGDVTLSLRYSVVIGYCGVVIGHCVICIEFLRYYCMEEFKYPFENLNAWQEAKKYVVEVYRVLETFPQHERFALCDQIRRAVFS
ncbi:MAG: four helix bundle protein [Bacteroidales bacterium]|nr:four helix bundle protein [Candidatus Sodaliphilus limicaballi]